MPRLAIGCEDDVMAGREGPKPEGCELMRVEMEAMRVRDRSPPRWHRLPRH